MLPPYLVASVAAELWKLTRGAEITGSDVVRDLLMSPAWSWRSPLLWWVYFFLGWWMRLHEARVRQWIARQRTPLCIASGITAVVCAAVMASTRAPQVALMTLMVYPVLGFILATSWNRQRCSRFVRLLSEASYPVYLFHVFFIIGAGSLIGGGRSLPVQLGTLFTVGLLGPLVLTLLARATLGRRSRDLVGY